MTDLKKDWEKKDIVDQQRQEKNVHAKNIFFKHANKGPPKKVIWFIDDALLIWKMNQKKKKY